MCWLPVLCLTLCVLAACGGPEGSSHQEAAEPVEEAAQGTSDGAVAGGSETKAGQGIVAGNGRSLVLISVDTLRADALGIYGGGGSPRIDAFAEGGWVFDQAMTPMPVTRPSHASMLTALHPRSHGVVSNAYVLDPSIPTVTEALAEAGWRTGAFTGVKLLAPGSGLERGFEVFEAPLKGEHVVASEVIPPAVEWLKEVAPQPFFLWLHVYDPHMPYSPPEPWFVPPPAPWSTEELPEFSRPALYPIAEKEGGNVPAALLAWALEQYAAEVSYVDAQLQELFSTLEAVAPEAAVILTADHGECFSKGYFFEHGPCLYEGSLHVPMVLKAPGRVEPGGRSQAQVSVIDVAPTLLDLAELTIPQSYRGRSLLSLMDGTPSGTPGDTLSATVDGAGGAEAAPLLLQRPLYDEDAQRRRQRRRSRISSVAGEPVATWIPGEVLGLRFGPESGTSWKYLASAAGEELYRLQEDPDERNNLVTSEPQEAASLRAQLRQELSATPLKAGAEALDDEMRRTLESLGY
ncbi:MAG: sulfatase [Acidobacteriota bacterium]